MMKERPILFSGPMVRAILEGRKTQTRRIVGPSWNKNIADACMTSQPGVGLFGIDARIGYGDKATCPYGIPGDRLWVRETWTHTGTGVWKVADTLQALDGKVLYASTDKAPCSGCWFPSIHMYRNFSRITLEITDVRVQRVQEISEDDARAEGARSADYASGRECILSPELGSYRLHFHSLWDYINAKRGFGWHNKPWVWALTFKAVR